MKKLNNYYINTSKIIRNIFIILTIIVFINMIIFPIIGRNELKTKTISIKSNDTLWSIASNIIKKGECKSKDINKVIYEIKKLNNFTDSTIYEGQTIEVPLY